MSEKIQAYAVDNNTPITAYGFKPRNGSKARSLGYEKEKMPTLSTDENYAVMIEVKNGRKNNSG